MVTDVISNYHLDASVNNTSVVVSDLKPFHTYEVQVAAHTIGLGPYSLETNITMPQSGKQFGLYPIIIIIIITINNCNRLYVLFYFQYL